MEIFENGYLKPEFINPNYRGITGFDCADDYEPWDGEGDYFREKLIATTSHSGGSIAKPKSWIFCYLRDDDSNRDGYVIELENLRVKEFTVEDIPEDEFVWVLDNICKVWYLIQKKLTKTVFKDSRLIVPHLIAETEADAIRLAEWE